MVTFRGAPDDGSREADAPQMVSGRVTECTLISSIWVYGDDRRAHTRLVIALESTGYRG